MTVSKITLLSSLILALKHKFPLSDEPQCSFSITLKDEFTFSPVTATQRAELLLKFPCPELLVGHFMTVLLNLSPLAFILQNMDAKVDDEKQLSLLACILWPGPQVVILILYENANDKRFYLTQICLCSPPTPPPPRLWCRSKQEVGWKTI